MADIKATSFRVSEEDIAKFKEFADKEGYNQAEAFKSIMQSVEMAQAKGIIKDRAKEIESFQDTINRLMAYYLNSLEVNQNSEERIREELSKELSTKDNTISTMYGQLQELKAYKINSDNNFKDIENKNRELEEQLQKSAKDIEDKNKSIDKLNSNNDLLQEQLQEYKQYKANYNVLEKKLEQLKTDQETLKDANTKLNNGNDLLNSKINNSADMIEFYKSNNIELKANIKSLEDKYNKQIDELGKAYNQDIINKEIELNNKNDIELQKKDLEIQRLNNEIDNLKSKNHRQVTNNIKK